MRSEWMMRMIGAARSTRRLAKRRDASSFVYATPRGDRLEIGDIAHWDLKHFCSGTVDVAYAVTPEGNVTGFRIITSAASDFLNRRTEIVFRDQVFHPARDLRGDAIAQRTWQRLRWSVLANGQPFLSIVRTRREALSAVSVPLGLTQPKWSTFSSYHRIEMQWLAWEEAEQPSVAAIVDGPVAALIDLSFKPDNSDFARARGLEGLRDWLRQVDSNATDFESRAAARLDAHIERNPQFAWLRDVWTGRLGHHCAART